MYEGSVPQNHLTPLFFVSMPKYESNIDELFSMTELIVTLVVVEPCKGKKIPLWYHTAKAGSMQCNTTIYQPNILNALSHMLFVTAKSLSYALPLLSL